MSKQNIAIVGLGTKGTTLMNALLAKKNSVNLACVVEPAETAGKAQAAAAGVKIGSIDELTAMGKDMDVIFDMTGNPSVVKELRHKIMVAMNPHTVIATEAMTHLVWALVVDA